MKFLYHQFCVKILFNYVDLHETHLRRRPWGSWHSRHQIQIRMSPFSHRPCRYILCLRGRFPLVRSKHHHSRSRWPYTRCWGNSPHWRLTKCLRGEYNRSEYSPITILGIAIARSKQQVSILILVLQIVLSIYNVQNLHQNKAKKFAKQPASWLLKFWLN